MIFQLEVFKYLNADEARSWRLMVNAKELAVSPYPVEIQHEQTNEALAKQALENQKSGKVLNKSGGEYRNRTGVHGFAIRCVTTPPTRLRVCSC